MPFVGTWSFNFIHNILQLYYIHNILQLLQMKRSQNSSSTMRAIIRIGGNTPIEMFELWAGWIGGLLWHQRSIDWISDYILKCFCCFLERFACFILRLTFQVSQYIPKKQVYLLRDLHIESLPAGFTGFPGRRRAPHQKLQKHIFPCTCEAVFMGILKPVSPDGRDMQQSLWSLFAYKTSSWRLFCSPTKQNNQDYLLWDPHIESLPAGFSGFPGHRRAPYQRLQKNLAPISYSPLAYIF